MVNIAIKLSLWHKVFVSSVSGNVSILSYWIESRGNSLIFSHEFYMLSGFPTFLVKSANTNEMAWLAILIIVHSHGVNASYRVLCVVANVVKNRTRIFEIVPSPNKFFILRIFSLFVRYDISGFTTADDYEIVMFCKASLHLHNWTQICSVRKSKSNKERQKSAIRIRKKLDKEMRTK